MAAEVSASMAEAVFEYGPRDPPVDRVVTIAIDSTPDDLLLEQTLNSVVSQSFQEWELIVGTGSQRHELGVSVDERVRPISQEHVGAALEESEAQFVIRLRPGDTLEPTAIEKCVWFLESHRDAAFVDSHWHDMASGDVRTSRTNDGIAGFDSDELPPLTLIRRATLVEAGGYGRAEPDSCSDWDLRLRIATLGRWGETVPEPLARRVQPEASHAFPTQLADRYPWLWQGVFPSIQRTPPRPNEWIAHDFPAMNRLAKNRRRVLLIVPWLSIGGADKFNLDLVEELRARGWEATIALTLEAPDVWRDLFGRQTPDIFDLYEFLRPADHPRFLRYLIQSRQPDVVLIINSELGYRLLPYLRAGNSGVAFADFCHSDIKRWNSGGYPRFSVEYRGLLDLTIASSDFLKSWMVARGHVEERVAVCYTNVDTKRRRRHEQIGTETRQRLAIPATAPVVLFLGRVSEDKQPHVLTETLVNVARHRPEVVALVAGDGPDLEWVRKNVQQKRLAKQIRLLGAVGLADVDRLLSVADVLFLPSLWEGIALTLFEAMAHEVPVVAAAVGGQSELVTPECGILVQRSDAPTEVLHYSVALVELIDDPVRRRAMGAAGRRRVEQHFRLEQMGDSMVELLETAAVNADTAPPDTPSEIVARAAATEVVEYIRALAAPPTWLTAAEALLGSGRTPWRLRTLVTAAKYGGPLYGWSVAHGMTWLVPLKERLVRSILPPTLR